MQRSTIRALSRLSQVQTFAHDTQDQTACFRQTQQGYSTVLTSAAYFVPLKVTSRYIKPNFQTGYVQSFHWYSEQLPAGVVMDLAYVGNKGTHLQILADYNQASPCLLATVTACNAVPSLPIRTAALCRLLAISKLPRVVVLPAITRFNSKWRSAQGALYCLNSFTYSRTFDLSAGHLEANERRSITCELREPT